MPRAAMTALSFGLRMLAFLLTVGTTTGAALHAQTTATPTSVTNASVTSAAATAGAATTTGAKSRGGALLSALVRADVKLKAEFYASPLGKLLVNMRKPLSALTGGLIQSESPLAAKVAGAAGGPPPSPAMGAAAKIKADAKQAAERREAVRYLGTVDCHYYPEAEQALVSALRCDRSECVRLEAALALGRGCCCTKTTMEALKISVSGSNRDGNPGETSLRVRMRALEALQNCLAHCNPIDNASPPPTMRPEYPGAPLAPQEELPVSAGSSGEVGREIPTGFHYYAELRTKPLARVLSEAEQIASHVSLAPQPELGGYGTGRRNLVSLWEQAASPESVMPPSQAFQPTPAPPPEMRVPSEVASRVDPYGVNYNPGNDNRVDYNRAPSKGVNANSNNSFGADPYAVRPRVAPPTREAPFDPATVPFPGDAPNFPPMAGGNSQTGSSYRQPPPPSLRRIPPVENPTGG